jgi:hypothetical protein
MATYTTTLTLNAGATEIDFAVASLDPLPTDQIELEAVLYNTLPVTNYDFSSTLFPNINQIISPPYTVSLLSTTAGFGSVYNDGVYRFYGSFTDSDSSVFYDSNAYMLNTTAIDAWWDTFLALENNTITNWQTIYKASKLTDKPSMTASIKPIRGGENYLINTDVKVPSSQNSIAIPDAIEKMIKSEKIDTGARLAAERKAKIYRGYVYYKKARSR